MTEEKAQSGTPANDPQAIVGSKTVMADGILKTEPLTLAEAEILMANSVASPDRQWVEMLDLQKDERPNNHDCLEENNDKEFVRYAFDHGYLAGRDAMREQLAAETKRAEEAEVDNKGLLQLISKYGDSTDRALYKELRVLKSRQRERDQECTLLPQQLAFDEGVVSLQNQLGESWDECQALKSRLAEIEASVELPDTPLGIGNEEYGRALRNLLLNVCDKLRQETARMDWLERPK